MAHYGEEKEEFESVDGQKDDEEKVEAGEREGGESAKDAVGGERDAELFCGVVEAGAELAIARVEEGKN